MLPNIILEAVSGFAFTLCGVETLNHCFPMASSCPSRKFYLKALEHADWTGIVDP